MSENMGEITGDQLPREIPTEAAVVEPEVAKKVGGNLLKPLFYGPGVGDSPLSLDPYRVVRRHTVVNRRRV